MISMHIYIMNDIPNVHVMNSDIQCCQRPTGLCGEHNCCRIPNPGRSDSLLTTSCYRPLVEQGGQREEKRWMPPKCSSSPILRFRRERREKETLGRNKNCMKQKAKLSLGKKCISNWTQPHLFIQDSSISPLADSQHLKAQDEY